jgi:hypothetical protein
MVVVEAGCSCSPLMTLFVPLVVTFGTLMGAVSRNVRRHFFATRRHHLPASQYRVKPGCLTASGVLGGNVVWLLKSALEEVVMSTLPWALRVAFGQHAHATLATMAVNMRFIVPPLLLGPQTRSQ